MFTGRVGRALCWGAIVSSMVLLAGGAPAGSPEVAKPMLAHWTFDEAFGTRCADSGQGGYHALPVPGRGVVQRIPGLLGNALLLSGDHILQITEQPNIGTVSELSLSAWVIPTDLSNYREIFRKEDGENRVLFSFQGDGTILSLGLNIDGYIECDAPIRPEQVLDGNWHLCAATFDGRAMRVYLDSVEVGALERVGEAVGGGPAPGCIGSSNGGESFQGAVDDLRIYSAALTPEDVAALYEEGRAAESPAPVDVGGDEPVPEHPLLAQYTFNEGLLSARVSTTTPAAAMEAAADGPVLHVPGVYGSAFSLRGENRVVTAGGPGLRESKEITFSAWTRPVDLSGFREIIRQECGERLLFSFQAGGTILSLGLNVGGYEECDATTKPEELVDGDWHHCAGTFDGATMRVFLDGREIGSLARAGAIAMNPDVPAYIGSSSGTSEFYQGALDDLRIYTVALTPDEIAALSEAGRQSLAHRGRALEKGLGGVYADAGSFAETMARTRDNLVAREGRLDLDMADALAIRLRQAYPDEIRRFTEYTMVDPLEFLASTDDTLRATITERLTGLLLEYEPLTPEQWAKQTSEQVERWHKSDEIAARLTEGAAQSAPMAEWLDLVLDAGSRIDLRPYLAEAVAPYAKPETPVTRDLTAEEARAALERDWLHQAGGNPSPERIRDEIRWTHDLVRRIRRAADEHADFGPQLARLAELEMQAVGLTEPSTEVYFAVREVKREVMFANPVVDFHRMLFVDMPYPQGSEWPHETRHRLGYMAVPGARLMVLEGLSPSGHLTQLMPQAPLHGSFWRPDVSFDGQRVLFCFKPHNEKSFHLYEVHADGTGLRQLTDGPYDDLDPIYLPDGEHIAFSTTRGHTYVRCMPPTNAYVLARCDLDGGDMYFISANNEPDYLPSVMDDGRIIYTRWEYTDKPLWRAQSLWTVHPDGTQVSVFWGNQSVWPDLLKDVRCIPGSPRVMFTGSAHHGWFSGSVGIIDPDKGFNFPDGLTKVTADVAWPEVGNGPVDPIESPSYHPSGAYGGYYSPYPLGERDFLVSANRNGKFVLYLMDVNGNRELIYEGVSNILHAIPLRARPRPPVLPDAVVWPTREERERPADGVIFTDNVYDGAPEQLQGKARYLRVLSIDPKTYSYWYKRPYISTGPEVSMVQSEGVKRIIGTVPIESDGSVAFYAPPGKALHFQLLDEHQRALQTMRSFVNVMPGERRGCLGCHELHSRAPAYGGKSLALAREPQAITPPPWDDVTVSYTRYVQPVLDQYCGKCHEGDGEARKVLDLTERPGFLSFDEPYVTLTGSPTWSVPYQAPSHPPPGFGIADTIMVEGYATTDPAAYKTPEPMTKLSYASRLIRLASSGEHYGVVVDPTNLQRLIVWVDTMCPYRGDEEVRAIADPEFQGVDWLAVRPRIATAPYIARPGPID